MGKTISMLGDGVNVKQIFRSRWQCRQTWLTSSHNHIKITPKIQNNHHSEPSDIKLNGSLTTTELKKPHPSRLVGGVETQNGLVPVSYTHLTLPTTT